MTQALENLEWELSARQEYGLEEIETVKVLRDLESHVDSHRRERFVFFVEVKLSKDRAI